MSLIDSSFYAEDGGQARLQGPTGEKGDTGAQGPAGPVGPTVPLPEYADNAAAAAGELPLGQLYATPTGEVRVRV
jgi:hypothetical protein